MILAHAETLAAAWHVVMHPPSQRRTPLAFAQTLTLRDGGPDDGQPFRPTPAQRAILLALESGWQRLVIIGPTQDGKTLVSITIPLMYSVVEDNRPALLVMDRQVAAEEAYLGRILPMLEAVGLGHLLPTSGTGSGRAAGESILFATGTRLHLRGAGGQNEGQQSSITVRLVAIDELDSIALSTQTARRSQGAEGRRKLELIERRRDAYQTEGVSILSSTIKSDRDSLILAEYDQSTRGQLWHPCPACGAHAPRAWEHVSYDPADEQTAAATARIACPACGVLLTTHEAQAAAERAQIVHDGQQITNGAVTGRMPPTTTWGIRWSALDSPRRSLANLAVMHLRATRARDDRGDHGPMRQFYRDQLARPYDSDDATVKGMRVEAGTIARHAAAGTYDQGSIPADLANGAVTVACDHQEREIYWLALVRLGDTSAIIDYGEEYLCHRHETPTPTQRRAALDRIRARVEAGFPVEGDPDRLIRPHACGMDVGGRGWLDQVDGWLRTTAWRWFACRGDTRQTRHAGDRPGAAIAQVPGWCDVVKRDDGRKLVLADADAIKRRLVAGLAADPAAPNAVRLPRGLAADSRLARHLAAEELIVEDGAETWVARSRNDYLDCAVYASALAALVLATGAAGRPPTSPAGPTQPRSPNSSQPGSRRWISI